MSTGQRSSTRSSTSSDDDPPSAAERAAVDEANIPGTPNSVNPMAAGGASGGAASRTSSTPPVPAGSASPASPGPRKRRKHDFEFGRVLGEGSFGQVREAVEIETGKTFAVKILSKDHVAREKKIKYVTTERDLLDLCKHPNIVRLYYTFSDTLNLYFVMELATQGELLTWLRTLEVFDLKTTQFYVAELILALEFLHSLNVVHRDLKPENILLDSNFHIKLTDFGTAKRLEVGDDTDPSKARSNSFLGTAEYVSPELLKHKYTCKSSDLWSLGCIMYQLLTGQLPFHAPTDYLIFQRIQKCDVHFPEDMSPIARDLLEKLLTLDPDDRPGAKSYAELKNHAFFEAIDWDNLPSTAAPQLSKFKPPERAECKAADSIRPYEEPTRSMKLAMQQESQWYQFVASDELIIKDGLVVKKKGLSSKKRVLILTDQPRLFYVDHKKNMVKGEIPWSNDLTCELKKGQNFLVHTPGRSYNLTDQQGNAAEWVDSIQALLRKDTISGAAGDKAPA